MIPFADSGEHTMKAIIQNRYGSPQVLQLGEIAEPLAADDQLLVRVHATSIHADVWHMMRGSDIRSSRLSDCLEYLRAGGRCGRG